MGTKRSNTALWRLTLPSGVAPDVRRDEVIRIYNALNKQDSSSFPTLRKVSLRQAFKETHIDLYMRKRIPSGFIQFIQGYATEDLKARWFHTSTLDACLFITFESALFAVTGGLGYHIIEDFIDDDFPFETGKKIIANEFSETMTRELAGSTTSRTETYRRSRSVDKSETFGTVWKKLVARVNIADLDKKNYITTLIDPNKPPAVEIKSSFVLRKSLDLQQLVLLARDLDELEPLSTERAEELSFLDNLRALRDADLEDQLMRELVDGMRKSIQGRGSVDLDLCDPVDISGYNSGANFKVSRWPLEQNPPDVTDLLALIAEKYASTLTSRADFYNTIMPLSLTYRADPDDKSTLVRRKLHECLHGEVCHRGKTYFLLDRKWYRSQGDFLENLKRDFIAETFSPSKPILITNELNLTQWLDEDEESFNLRQGFKDGFYYGDRIFARSDRGKVELFDLLKVDHDNKKLYVIHAKDGFDAKMRDACSQIVMSAEVISRDLKNEKKVLRKYYREDWTKNEENRKRQISEESFLSWFDYAIVYVVLAATKNRFTREDFEHGRLRSHIARREILVTKNDFKKLGFEFRLAHNCKP
ncbi:DUF6119 family protein [Kutzneria sp. 744]|uniref:DUF6119 family protein n=1 Tax=Kutzneria sp. (strain 744) TaxID=345341 RepID=UPI0004B44764|nr:DUF6119 family protein [Kutzneria sp. 744]